MNPPSQPPKAEPLPLQLYQLGLGATRQFLDFSVKLGCRLGFLAPTVKARLDRWPRQILLSDPNGRSSPSQELPSKRIWFHAASHGELESLWLVILQVSFNPLCEVVVTVFSASADRALERLREEIQSKGGRLLWSGPSPLEGDWHRAWDIFKPHLWVTAKTEAWPEVWSLAALNDVPVLVIGARPRLALQLAAKANSILTGRPLRLVLAGALPSELSPLQRTFPSAQVECTGDPRWDRVIQRVELAGHKAINKNRGKFLLERYGHLERPFTLLAQAWPSDLDCWGPCFESLTGTLWVVPHQVDEEMVSQMKDRLKGAGFDVVQTSKSEVANSAGEQRLCVLVDEMGVLLDLYGGMDRVYVGGGFHRGVHSTLEPAISGVPIACGPKKVDRFSEVEVLKADGHLTVITNSDELEDWLCSGWGEATHEDATGRLKAQKARWAAEARAHAGGTQRVLALIQNLLKES